MHDVDGPGYRVFRSESSSARAGQGARIMYIERVVTVFGTLWTGARVYAETFTDYDAAALAITHDCGVELLL